MLKPYEHLMRNYSSAKLELLALKWSVCKKFRDYLIGLKFTILANNNPLTYVHTSHLGAAQIHWLSDLVLFDFDIRYRAGMSNQAADALSQWPINPESSSESSDDEDEWETISYEMVCQILDHHLDSTKIPFPVKYEVQSNTVNMETANVLVALKLVSVIDSQFKGVKLFGTILPKQMAKYQKKDNQLSVIYEFVAGNQKPKLSEIHCTRSKPIRHLLLQYDCLSLIRGYCITRLFRTMMKSNNLFFLVSCVVMFLSHCMMTMVIRVYSVF